LGSDVRHRHSFRRSSLRSSRHAVAHCQQRVWLGHLARSGKARRNEAAQIALLVAQIGSLSLSVSRLREAQGRTAQAAAARRAASHVADSAERWVGAARGLVTEQECQQATTTCPRGSSARSARAADGQCP